MLSAKLVKLVEILNDGLYHTGDEMGELLNLSRSGVWKIIKKLEHYQINIDSIKGKGYALLEPLILLNQKTIQKGIDKENLLTIFESVNSTNDYLKLFFNQKKIQVCLAERQTAGRGRLNRSWHSPFGKNIYLSLLYTFDLDVSEIYGLSLVIGLAICQVLECYGLPKPLWVKWPNDIIYDDRKLAGILIELQGESHGHCKAVIGVGLNVNALSKEKNLISSWTSLRRMTGEYIDRNQLCIRLINTLLSYIHQFQKKGLNHFLTEWKAVDFMYGKKIALKQNGKPIEGEVKGIDESGNLLMKILNGSVQAFSSGDVSIIKK